MNIAMVVIFKGSLRKKRFEFWW